MPPGGFPCLHPWLSSSGATWTPTGCALRIGCSSTGGGRGPLLGHCGSPALEQCLQQGVAEGQRGSTERSGAARAVGQGAVPPAARGSVLVAQRGRAGTSGG